jgi:hypothetical protein
MDDVREALESALRLVESIERNKKCFWTGDTNFDWLLTPNEFRRIKILKALKQIETKEQNNEVK